MKPVQIVVLGIAVVAALALAFLARGLMTGPEPKVEAVIEAPREIIFEVLIAKERIPMGSTLKVERLEWEERPERIVRETHIVKNDDPEALQKYAKYIALGSFLDGEVIRKEKLVRSNSGYLSAILPSGKRAVAVRVRAESSAGGFVLPNDHVDIIRPQGGDEGPATAETILRNIRVLAVDQVIEEKGGKRSRVGETATLELTPTQSETVAAAQTGGAELVLALRSIADSKRTTGAEADAMSGSNKRSTLRMIRGGATTDVEIARDGKPIAQATPTSPFTAPNASPAPVAPTPAPAADPDPAPVLVPGADQQPILLPPSILDE